MTGLIPAETTPEKPAAKDSPAGRAKSRESKKSVKFAAEDEQLGSPDASQLDQQPEEEKVGDSQPDRTGEEEKDSDQMSVPSQVPASAIQPADNELKFLAVSPFVPAPVEESKAAEQAAGGATAVGAGTGVIPMKAADESESPLRRSKV
jgi:hypothetical protein